MTGVIRSKPEFYRLWRAGCLGNRPRTWATVEELHASNYRGNVTIRTVGRAGGLTRYGIAADQVARWIVGWPGTPTFNEAMPDDRLLVQGEVMQASDGLVLYYSTARGIPMNVARREFREAHGVTAVFLLRHYLWPSSFDDLAAIFDLYSDAVIEFGAYDCAVGDQRHRNTIIWEVRNY